MVLDLKHSDAEVWLVGPLAGDLVKNTLVSFKLLILEPPSPALAPADILKRTSSWSFVSSALISGLAMISAEQVNEIHRLHLVEKWSQRRIARHLHIGRHTLAKYLDTPALPPSHRNRTSKLDVFKAAIAELLQQDPKVPAQVLFQRLQTLGYDGGITILKDYLQAVRKNAVLRRAYLSMESSPGEQFDIDWGHFGALSYNGTPRKLYAFGLVECPSRKMYLRFTHSQSFETFVRCHMHAFQTLGGRARSCGLMISPLFPSAKDPGAGFNFPAVSFSGLGSELLA